MAGVGKRIEEAVKALDQKQIKKALYLTTKRGLERHHDWVEEAARTCLANKDNPDVCGDAIKGARDKLQSTITVPMDSADLEGVEEYLTPKTEVKEEQPVGKREMTDEELYDSCHECHIADAVVKFVSICEQDCSGETCRIMQPLLEDGTTPPEKWLHAMREVAGQEGCGQEAYKTVLGELETYLKGKDSDILKKAQEVRDG